MKYISVSVYVIPCIRGRKGYCICEEASDTRWTQTIERNFASSLLHQALQRPSTFEQTGLDLELVHIAGSRPWDRGRGWRKGTGLQKKCFWPFGPQFGLKIRGGAPGPFRWIRHWFLFSLRHTLQVSQFLESITSTLFSCWFISLKKKNTHTRS